LDLLRPFFGGLLYMANLIEGKSRYFVNGTLILGSTLIMQAESTPVAQSEELNPYEIALPENQVESYTNLLEGLGIQVGIGVGETASEIVKIAKKDEEVVEIASADPSTYSIDELISWASIQMKIPESKARKIVGCESKFNSYAVNPLTDASGLWQLMPLHAPKFVARGWNWPTDRFNPYKNTVVAIEVANNGLNVDAAWRGCL
jgi:hypothetical protein